jgi:protein TonB
MAREGLRRYLTGSVPISIGLHLIAVLLFLGIPLTARIVLPMVAVDLPEYVRLAPMPPPPLVSAPATTRRLAPTVVPAPPPTAAPPTITDEPLVPPRVAIAGPPDAAIGIPPGTDGAVGTAMDPPTVLLPPVPHAPGPVRVAELPVAPRKTNDVRPVYPDVARMARVDGTVVLEAVLDPAGRVTQLRVITSVPLLDQAALAAVRQWRYTPSLYGGRPVSVLMTITIRFTLQ